MSKVRAGNIRIGRVASASLVALLGLHAGSAAAADLAERARPRFIDWSGFYAGLQGSAGASFGNYDFGPTTIGPRRVRSVSTGDATGSRDLGGDATTVVGGAFAGWTWQSGAFVYGIEADLAGANLKRGVRSDATGFGYEAIDPPFALIREKTDVFGSARARFGYAFGNNLIYATLGLTGANGRVLATYPDLAGDRRPAPLAMCPISATRWARAYSSRSIRISRSGSTTVTATSARAVASVSAPCRAPTVVR